MIKIIECPRDAMQGLNNFVPTELKVKYINSLLKVGFDTLDFGSFVSPKAIPQMADTTEVLSKLDLEKTNTKLLSIVANVRGAEQALQYNEISYLGYPFSVSETFGQRNTKTSVNDSFELVKKIQELCVSKHKTLVVYLSMAFGNPYNDVWSVELVLKWIQKLQKIGIKIVSLADTTSTATVNDIDELISLSKKEFNKIEFGLHLHTSKNNWLQKIEVAFNAGCKRYDTAIGGFGGCPFATNELVGNLNTENLIDFLKSKNQKIQINESKLKDSVVLSQKIFN